MVLAGGCLRREGRLDLAAAGPVLSLLDDVAGAGAGVLRWVMAAVPCVAGTAGRAPSMVGQARPGLPARL